MQDTRDSKGNLHLVHQMAEMILEMTVVIQTTGIQRMTIREEGRSISFSTINRELNRLMSLHLVEISENGVTSKMR